MTSLVILKRICTNFSNNIISILSYKVKKSLRMRNWVSIKSISKTSKMNGWRANGKQLLSYTCKNLHGMPIKPNYTQGKCVFAKRNTTSQGHTRLQQWVKTNKGSKVSKIIKENNSTKVKTEMRIRKWNFYSINICKTCRTCRIWKCKWRTCGNT